MVQQLCDNTLEQKVAAHTITFCPRVLSHSNEQVPQTVTGQVMWCFYRVQSGCRNPGIQALQQAYLGAKSHTSASTPASILITSPSVGANRRAA